MRKKKIYYLRLDDACEKRDIEKWNRLEVLLDKYQVCPLVGVIPNCQDSMMEKYEWDNAFWDRVEVWKKKGWSIALHGYDHVYISESGGVNPVNKMSEFAGVPVEVQTNKLKRGIDIFHSHGVDPKVFFAPAHTFDKNTLRALKKVSNIRIISDTIARKPYRRWGFTFIPQQSGHVRKLPFDTVTFCYHPNTMNDNDFYVLERFLSENRHYFKKFEAEETDRTFDLIDMLLRIAYFLRRR